MWKELKPSTYRSYLGAPDWCGSTVLCRQWRSSLPYTRSCRAGWRASPEHRQAHVGNSFKGRSDQLSCKRCRKQQSESWLHNIKGCSHRIHSTLLPAANTAPRSARWDVHLGIAMLKLVKELMMMISALCNWLYNQQLLTLLWVCLVSLSKTKRNSYNTDKSWFTPTTTNQGWQLCTTGSHHNVQPQCRTFLTQYMPRLGLYLSSTTLSGMPTHR